ncbi:MAG: DUF4331 domain-containing protein [Acidobacteria bacterium]|nr:DUF4331 domain-containing protein [Acidobacteriota bacterium]
MTSTYRKLHRGLSYALMTALVIVPQLLMLQTRALASSHMDAPMATLDPAANTTDVYAFVTIRGGVKMLNLHLGVYPHENPGIGPSKYNFDDNVRYEIHVAQGQDIAAGRPSVTYRFEFKTTYKTQKTILQSFIGVINDIDDAGQNLTQTYTVTKIDNRAGTALVLGTGKVPPNNQGNATPFYNEGNNPEAPARKGVSTRAELDKYTQQAITPMANGYIAFAGQRDDGFYADIQSIFDLLQLRNPGKDSQGGYNLHLMSLAFPVSDIGGEAQTIGVYATTSRPRQSVVRTGNFLDIIRRPEYVQVARQGNPLFNEGLVALEDKDTYSRNSPAVDNALFRKYAETPELAALINAIIGKGTQLAIPNNRADIAAIYIPDLLKVDLSTAAARLAGNGPTDANNPDDMGFSRLSIFGGDILESATAGHPFRLPSQFLGLPAGKSFVPGGWPNGRRFGDDPVDIAIIALLSDLRDPANLKINDPFRGNYDGVTANELGFNKTFPYESTPQNGRNIVGMK